MITATPFWTTREILLKLKNQGVTEDLGLQWLLMPKLKVYKAETLKNFNLPFENHILGQPQVIRDRMADIGSKNLYTICS